MPSSVAVRRRWTALFAVLAVLGTGCGRGHDRAANPVAATTVASDEREPSAMLVKSGSRVDDPNGFSLPDFVVDDPGGVRSVSVVDQLSELPPGGWPEGLSIALDTCDHVAPGRWQLRGSIAGPVPADPLPVLWSLIAGDLGSTTALLIDIDEPGPFQLGIDLTDRVNLQWERWQGSCELAEQEGKPVPRRTEVPVSPSDQPLAWEAPTGTVQAAGMGAVLSDNSDPRVSWAYLAWERTALPFEELWLPNEVGGAELQPGQYEPDSSGCTTISYQLSDAYVTHENGCLTSYPTTGQTLAGGWELFENGADRGAVLHTATMTVQVHVFAGGEVAGVISRLSPTPNLFTRPPAPQPTVDVDRFIAKTVENLPGTFIVDARERGRVPLEGGFLVVAIGKRPGVTEGLVAWATTVRGSGTSWSGGGGTGVEYDGCAARLYAGDNAGALHNLIVLDDPTWKLQTLSADVWTDLPTIDGIWYDPTGYAPPDLLPQPTLRALTADGTPATCAGLDT